MIMNKKLKRIFLLTLLTITFTYTNSSEKAEAKILGQSFSNCGPYNYQLCWVIEFGDGWYFYGWGIEYP